MSFRLDPDAIADLNHIHRYISRDNPPAADRVIDDIFKAIEMFERHPEAGVAIERYAPGLRRFTVWPYVIYYRPHGDLIEVVRVLHGAQDADAEFS